MVFFVEALYGIIVIFFIQWRYCFERILDNSCGEQCALLIVDFFLLLKQQVKVCRCADRGQWNQIMLEAILYICLGCASVHTRTSVCVPGHIRMCTYRKRYTFKQETSRMLSD